MDRSDAKSVASALRRTGVLVVVGGVLTGCGQKGPLTLPPPANPVSAPAAPSAKPAPAAPAPAASAPAR